MFVARGVVRQVGAWGFVDSFSFSSLLLLVLLSKSSSSASVAVSDWPGRWSRKGE